MNKVLILNATLPLSLPSLHVFLNSQVTDLIISNGILLLEALHVIRDVWGGSRPCHRGGKRSLRAARTKGSQPELCCRWDTQMASQSAALFPQAPLLAVLIIPRDKAWYVAPGGRQDAWQRCHLNVGAPEHCVNGVLRREWVLMGLQARI